MPLKTLLAFATTSLAVCMTACTSFNGLPDLKPGLSSEADATAVAGKPTYVWQNPDGTHTLEYSQQPRNGEAAYMVAVDANGKVLKVSPVVIDPNTTRIEYGMTREQVRRLLGTPRSIANYSLSGEEVWDWNVPFTSGVESRVRFNVHFKDGKVIRTSRFEDDTCTRYTLLPC